LRQRVRKGPEVRENIWDAKKNTDADVCKAIFPAVGGNVIKMTHTNDFLTTKCAHTYTN